jgi:hypothetical protein
MTHLLNFSTGEPHKWAMYYSCFISAPVSYLLISSRTLGKFTDNCSESVKGYLACVLLTICLLIQPGSANLDVLLFGFLFVAVCLYFEKRKNPIGHDRLEISLYFLLCALSWKLAYRFLWWESHPFKEILLHKTLIFFLALLFASFVLYQNIFRKNKPEAILVHRLLSIVSILFFVYLCGRPYVLDGGLLHHQSFYVGPIALLKQGGLLLWDIPSQYGFLNIYLASKVNIGSTWQSFMILIKFFIFSSSIILYFYMRRFFKTISGHIFSTIVAAFGIFCWAGYIATMVGPFRLPSVGAFRFIWCYVLITICYFLCSSDYQSKIKKWSWLYALGTCVWIVSVFWSVESAIYNSLIWLTFNFVRSYVRIEKISVSIFFNKVIAQTCLLLIFPTAAFLFFSCAYFIMNSHVPDWHCFTEYATAYQDGFGALPITPQGAVWSLLSIFVLGTIVTILSIRSRSAFSPLMASSLALMWALASYFTSRSHENNISNLMPLIIVFVVSILIVASQLNLSRPFLISLFLIMVPFFQVIVEAPLTTPLFLEIFANGDHIDYLGKKLDQEIPPQSTSLDDLDKLHKFKESLGIQSGDPSVLLSTTTEMLPDTLILPEYWLPIAPEAEFEILRPQRQEQYLDRFSIRKMVGGWLFHLTNDPNKYESIYKLLEKKYTLIEKKSDGEWIAERFEYKRN